MLLNQKNFHQDIATYYNLKNYDGLQTFLENKERELKQQAMPDPGCMMCKGQDLDDDGIAAVNRGWIKKWNQAVAIITYEQGRLFQL